MMAGVFAAMQQIFELTTGRRNYHHDPMHWATKFRVWTHISLQFCKQFLTYRLREQTNLFKFKVFRNFVIISNNLQR